MSKPNTIKVFYHPLSVVVNVEKVAGERYFFMEKPKALFEALQKEGLNFKHHTYEPFTWKDFELCHDPGYVEAVRVRGGQVYTLHKPCFKRNIKIRT